MMIVFLFVIVVVVVGRRIRQSPPKRTYTYTHFFAPRAFILFRIMTEARRQTYSFTIKMWKMLPHCTHNAQKSVPLHSNSMEQKRFAPHAWWVLFDCYSFLVIWCIFACGEWNAARSPRQKMHALHSKLHTLNYASSLSKRRDNKVDSAHLQNYWGYQCQYLNSPGCS